jgi:hypothetical protein
VVGCALVSTAEDQDLHQTVENHRITDARIVAAPRMTVLTGGQQGKKLVADRVENA